MHIKFKELPSGKYTFYVEGNDNATAFLLKNTINHTISANGMKFAIPALEKLLLQYNPCINYSKDETNSVVVLSEYIQKKYGQSISSKVVSSITSKKGDTEITVEILVMNRSFTGIGRNQRIARQVAAQRAITYFGIDIKIISEELKKPES